VPRLPPGSGRWPYRVVFWPDGRRLTTVSGDGVLKVWDLTAIDFRKPSPVMSVETSGESHIADGGPRLAWLRWSQAARWAADTVVVADLAGRELRAIRLPGQASRQVVLSGDGRRLAVVGHSDRAVRLYDTDTGERVGLVHDTASPVVHVAYRDGGKVLRVTLADGSLREWDPAARAPLRSARVALPEGDPARRLPLLLPGERPRVSPFALPEGEYRVAISADGRLWATATADGRCRVWDTATRRPRFEPAERLHVPKPPPSRPVPH